MGKGSGDHWAAPSADGNGSVIHQAAKDQIKNSPEKDLDRDTEFYVKSAQEAPDSGEMGKGTNKIFAEEYQKAQMNRPVGSRKPEPTPKPTPKPKSYSSIEDEK